jgi:5'-3' exonuclease
MGVPGFFSWLKKKYKNKKFVFIKEFIKNTNIIQENSFLQKEISEIDCLLIDTNCLIHPVSFKIQNENLNLNDYSKLKNKIFNAIKEYILKIIDHVDPKKYIYIAIDGVAPLAKVKQQRQRRFKSTADKKLWDNIKKKHSRPIHTPLWNNSSVTPGTEFMEELHQYLLNWLKNLNKTNIIYSSYLSPGEGEHKLLQFIRSNQLNNNNYSYVIYGLDADLIFLALSTNCNKIYLLRESNEIDNGSDDILTYVSINIMKELIINTITNYYNNKYLSTIIFDNENIINDFIFMCYFLGNDFLPHIPSLNIHQNGIEYLIINYIDTINEILNEYKTIQYLLINENYPKLNKKSLDVLELSTEISCNINYLFLKKFLFKLSNQEENNLKSNLNKKFQIYHNKVNFNDPYEKEIFRIENLQFKIKDPIQLGLDNHTEWRIRYYKHYWNIEDDKIEEFSENLVKNYLIGLKWISLYYFDKCPSWDWYYPFDYPPFLSDIYKYYNKINYNKIKFKLGKPIKPLLQLLIVLPIQLNYLLPYNFNKITYENNEIEYLYPYEFEQDFINKKKHWMAIPILPQLNIDLVKKIYLKYKMKLSTEEKLRNVIIDNFIFLKKS